MQYCQQTTNRYGGLTLSFPSRFEPVESFYTVMLAHFLGVGALTFPFAFGGRRLGEGRRWMVLWRREEGDGEWGSGLMFERLGEEGLCVRENKGLLDFEWEHCHFVRRTIIYLLGIEWDKGV